MLYITNLSIVLVKQIDALFVVAFSKLGSDVFALAGMRTKCLEPLFPNRLKVVTLSFRESFA